MLEEVFAKYIKIEKERGKTDKEITEMINAGLEKLETIQKIKGEQIV